MKPNKKSLNLTYWEYRKSARRRGLQFTLTKDEVSALVQKKCHYCGARPKIKSTKWCGSGRIGGIDRKSVKRGYTTKNTVPCCWTCNYMKGTMSSGQFIALCRRISDRHS